MFVKHAPDRLRLDGYLAARGTNLSLKEDKPLVQHSEIALRVKRKKLLSRIFPLPPPPPAPQDRERLGEFLQ